MDNNWIKLDQSKYESICFILNKKIIIENKIHIFSNPVYHVEKKVVKKTFGGTKEVTKTYLKSIKIFNYDFLENIFYDGYANLEFVENMITFYNVEAFRKNYLNIERQFKMFQEYEDKQIQKEFIDVKKL